MKHDNKNKLQQGMTVGIDVGDKSSHVCILGVDGKVSARLSIRTRAQDFEHFLGHGEGVRVVLEVGTHSPWLSRLLERMGHEVIVANPRQLKLIYADARKSDRVDAEHLARLGRVDASLLYPIRHKQERSQEHLAVVRSRDRLVQTRTKLIQHLRAVVKSSGNRLPPSSTASFARNPKVLAAIPEALKPALLPVLEMIGRLTECIDAYDLQIESLCQKHYPQTAAMRQIRGVGALTALTFVLTIDDPARFQRSRDVGAYLGLVPRRSQSGDSNPQLRISKRGDAMMRRLLVNAAHYVLQRGDDSDVRRHGLKICERGGKNAKKRAVIAVARKLAVLMHRLWITGEEYEPLRNSNRNLVELAA
jgi:transposase